MRTRVPQLLSGAALAMAQLIATPLVGVASAQVAGDEKCSPDGYVMTYNAYLKQWDKQWFRKCSGGGDSSSSRSRSRYAEEDSDEEPAPRRRAAREDDGGSAGQPEDGDEKCVGGYILKYNRYTYLKSGWSNTYRRC